MTLGIADNKDNRNFTVDVPFNTFTDVLVSNTPASSFTAPRLTRE
jgi:hypothetical protein